MTETLSRKLSALQFLLAFFVVLAHMVPWWLVEREPFDAGSLSSALSHLSMTVVFPHMTGIPVPMFFAISGFLFFRGFEGGTAQFVAKWKRRFWSLAVPYTLWSAIYLGGVIVWQSTPLSNLDPSIHVSYRAGELLNRLFIDSFAEQFWFLRDLILLVMFSPVIWWLVRRFGLAPSLIMGGLWLQGIGPSWTREVISLSGPFFFSVGAWLAVQKIDLETPIKGRRILGISWLASLVAIAYLSTFYEEGYPSAGYVAILLGILAIWCNYDLLRPVLESSLFRWMSRFSFFVYAGHLFTEPMVDKAFETIWPFGEWSLLLMLLVGGATLTANWIVIGVLTRRLFPRTYSLLTGGRGGAS